MEFETQTSVNTEQVADVQTTEADVTSEVATDETLNTSETVAEGAAKPQQTAEENARFAENRRKQELEEAKKQALELNAKLKQAEKDREMAQSVLKQYWEGDDLETLTINAMAQATGRTAEEVKAERERMTAAELKEQELQDKLSYYEQREQRLMQLEAEKAMQADLAELQKLDPNLKSLDELGEQFTKYRFLEDPVTNKPLFTLEEIYTKLKGGVKTPTPTMGGLNTTTTADKEFYTPDEVDRLTDEDYEKNPKLLSKVRNSMLRWKIK